MIIGWREWVGLPGLGVAAIKAKVDTGARTSALHAFNVHVREKDGETWVDFHVHPVQRHAHPSIACTARLHGRRNVRSSNGEVEERLVIRTPVQLGRRRWKMDITLTNRDEMGFRMLLGRRALRRRCLVDPGHSYLLGERDGSRKTASAPGKE